MRKRLAYIFSTAMIVAVMMLAIGVKNNVQTVAETQSTTENPGDIVDNPWSDLFDDKDKDGNLPLDSTTTAKNDVITNNVSSSNSKIAKVTIKKVYTKKRSSNKLKVKIKKVSGVKGYQIAVYKTSKYAKKNKKALVKKYVKKTTITLKSSKLKNKKKLYVKVRAYKASGNKKKYGAWSKTKKVKIKK